MVGGLAISRPSAHLRDMSRGGPTLSLGLRIFAPESVGAFEVEQISVPRLREHPNSLPLNAIGWRPPIGNSLS